MTFEASLSVLGGQAAEDKEGFDTEGHPWRYESTPEEVCLRGTPNCTWGQGISQYIIAINQPDPAWLSHRGQEVFRKSWF